MFWIRLLGRTLDSERQALAFYIANTAALVLIFNLMMDTVSIVYPVCFSLAILAVYVAAKAFALFRFEETLEAAAAVGGNDIAGDTGKEQRVFDTIEHMHASYLDQLSSMNDKLEGRNSLFSQFIHNMKSSVAVIELACEKQASEVLPDIASENEKLRANLEQSLNLLRLDAFSNDYVPESVDLHALVQSVINEKRRDFIYAKVYPKLSGGAAYAYTDRKWCAYLLDQIITNAIKYSKPGRSVYFAIEADSDGEAGRTTVRIRDEGEGIEPDDLPRVFELFYTGKNGRANPNATGIGLAMVKHIAKRLGHEVSLTSVAGEGTSVTIEFLSKMKDYRKSNPF